MARVRITKARNSRTHAALPMGWTMEAEYRADEFDNTHYKLYRYMGEDDLDDTLVWPIEDVEIIPDLVPVSLSERGERTAAVVAALEKKGLRRVAKPKIASTGSSTDYYVIPEWCTELRHLIQHKNMNFDVGNIFKAAYRLGEKEGIGHEYDLEKIIFFAQSELERIRRDKNG